MTISDYFHAVDADPELRGVHIEIDDLTITVQEMDDGWYTTFHASVILEKTWEALKGYAMGTKDIAPLYHVTRVVGYYSRIENWNASKLGELRDRRTGNYAIPDVIRIGAGAA
jgi:hypothetical protein